MGGEFVAANTFFFSEKGSLFKLGSGFFRFQPWIPMPFCFPTTPSPRSWRLPVGGAALVCALAAGPLAAQPDTESLDVLLHEAVEAFSASRYARAADRFAAIKERHGDDPRLRERGFLRRILPLRGYAQLQSGAPAAAVETLEGYLEHFSEDGRPNAFVLYHTALANRRAGRVEEALGYFETYNTHYPDRPEATLSILQRVEILFELSRREEAEALLRTFAESDAPEEARQRARLTGARRALDAGGTEFARLLLLDFPWNLEATRNLSALSAAALQLGDRLMKEDRHREALRAYRLVLPRRQLIAAYEERMRDRRNRGPLSTPGSAQPERESERIRTLRETPDHTPAWKLRKGRAFLFGGRPREAWLVFEAIALDDSMPADVREQGHYHWILAAQDLEEWEEALTIARNHTARYADSELAPRAFYLIAQAHREQRRHAEAVDVLTDLIDGFPDHPLAQRWTFTRGFCLALLDKYSEARGSFEQARDTFAESGLTTRADLWHALTYFFEADYETALNRIDELADAYADHPMAGEILYRRAVILYAKGDGVAALESARTFTQDHPLHERHAEALVLKGDILLAAGDLEEAIAIYSTVPAERESLHLYATFQIGKALRAQGEYATLARHFRNHLESGPGYALPRVSEALYWIGWAQVRLGRPESALNLYLDTLDHFGDDRDAGEFGTILSALADLHDQLSENHIRDAATLPARARILVATSDFEKWLESERERAERKEQPTRYARLTLALSQRRRSAGRTGTADTLLLELANTIPANRLDARCLGHAGYHLANNRLGAGESLLRRLLEDFPESPERAYAYYGLARIAEREGDHEEALRLLRRFQTNTPGHALAIDAGLLQAGLLRQSGSTGAARRVYEDLLANRAARGRPQARALLGLAEIHQNEGQPEQAIAYYQRIYTVFRAYPEFTGQAYYQSALLFEELGDVESAHATLAELETMERFDALPFSDESRRHRERLANALPGDDAAQTSTSAPESSP